MILARAHIADRLTHDDDLRLRVARGFQEDGVHVDHRREPRRLCLRDLRASHLAPVECDIGVQRHILRLKRHNAPSLLQEDTAERRRQNALADMGTRSHQHDGLCHTKYPPPIS